MKLFSGTANPNLSQKVAEILGTTVSESEVVRFENSEVRVRVSENVHEETCAVIQSISNPTDSNLMELFLFCDALRREQAKKVIVVMPYLGYARQNIQHRSGEAVSMHVVIRLLEALGVSRVVTCDIHDEGSMGIFSIPMTHISTLPLLAARLKEDMGDAPIGPDTIAIVSPDQGGIERARTFGKAFFGNDTFDLTVIEKSRDPNRIHTSQAVSLFGDVKGKKVIIVDDVTTSGGTLIHAAERCLEAGATSAIATIAHHDFGDTAAAKIEASALERIYSTNTIALKDEHRFDSLVEVDIASVIAESLR